MSLRIATKIAEANPGEKWKLGAVIRKGGRVMAVGWNIDKNDPLNVDGDWSACSVHAEMAALRQVNDASGAIVYVARITPGGKIAMAKPCVRCQSELRLAGVKRALFTIDQHTHGVWKP